MKCNWCKSAGSCIPDCLCSKCIDPQKYNNEFKYNEDGTFTEKYKNILTKNQLKFRDKRIQVLETIAAKNLDESFDRSTKYLNDYYEVLDENMELKEIHLQLHRRGFLVFECPFCSFLGLKYDKGFDRMVEMTLLDKAWIGK